MRQASLKLKSYVDQVNIVNNHTPYLALRVILWSFGALSLCYVLILGNMVFNIVERKALESQARNLGNDVGDLELQYLALSNKVDLNLSYAMGFRETKATFTTRKALGSIKVATNEI